MTKKTRFVFKLLSVIKKCRDRGKYALALKLIDKYKVKKVNSNYYD